MWHTIVFPPLPCVSMRGKWGLETIQSEAQAQMVAQELG